ncbi:D-proline reductase (dithiol) protein PrdB [Spiroplasma alleghenense]|uniref:D-proline reductase (Dithiol) PrdB n=1 Tax=Spiroplasma alleghenense TaxID=216931 RepID=A0A345Z2P8_9MOLU|nr:D-proline reductase (dithiol) protein PrdB [Spiroplasma alleghenense]AXK50877.1 D-proline reductase (dithiol) PrdB [Spiroplasma alleghenense]
MGIKGLKSEIYVPITPPPVWAEVKKPLKEMRIALATAAGVHLKKDKPFNLAGDTSYRIIPGDAPVSDMMVSHGGYDNGDVNKDINCMFPIDRIRELAKEGFIKEISPVNVGFMGGGGNQHVFTDETGPAIAKILKDENVDAVLLTAGRGTCHRTAVIVQRAIEALGIPTIIIAALPPVCAQNGTPRAVAPLVPMGANAGEPNNREMQYNICKESLEWLIKIDQPGKIIPLPYEYHANI